MSMTSLWALVHLNRIAAETHIVCVQVMTENSFQLGGIIRGISFHCVLRLLS